MTMAEWAETTKKALSVFHCVNTSVSNADMRYLAEVLEAAAVTYPGTEWDKQHAEEENQAIIDRMFWREKE